MKKSDLITALAAKENLTHPQAAETIDLLFAEFSDALKKRERIEIRGFGSFSVREYKAYRGRNPKTGALVQVRPKRLPFFKVGKGLKKRVDTI